MKRLLIYLFTLPAYLLGHLFYERKYLRSKYFRLGNIEGAVWLYRSLFSQKILRINSKCPWPIFFMNRISSYKNIEFDVDDIHNFQNFGIYFQNFDGFIKIGKGTFIGPNVGLITSNHDPKNLNNHIKGKDIVIGENCWIGMNSVILPGVVIGSNNIIGAGSIVTKSFPDGYCLIAGNPAKFIKKYD